MLPKVPSILIYSATLLSTVLSNNDTVIYSARPSIGLPVTKVDVLGKQILVRQPFNNHLPTREDESPQPNDDDLTAKIFSPFLATVDGFSQKKQQKRLLPLPTTSTTTTTNTPQPLVRVEAARQRRQYKEEPSGYYTPKQQFPLSQCYTNKAGFMCCNERLENLMHETFANLTTDPGWQNCNVQRIANQIQTAAQKEFGMEFEALAGIGDFASKTHFYSDLICKTEKEGRFMLAYATPNRHRKPPAPPPPPPYRMARDVVGRHYKVFI